MDPRKPTSERLCNGKQAENPEGSESRVTQKGCLRNQNATTYQLIDSVTSSTDTLNYSFSVVSQQTPSQALNSRVSQNRGRPIAAPITYRRWIPPRPSARQCLDIRPLDSCNGANKAPNYRLRDRALCRNPPNHPINIVKSTQIR